METEYNLSHNWLKLTKHYPFPSTLEEDPSHGCGLETPETALSQCCSPLYTWQFQPMGLVLTPLFQQLVTLSYYEVS